MNEVRRNPLHERVDADTAALDMRSGLDCNLG